MERMGSGEKFVGTRCHICTGCGRCADIPSGVAEGSETAAGTSCGVMAENGDKSVGREEIGDEDFRARKSIRVVLAHGFQEKSIPAETEDRRLAEGEDRQLAEAEGKRIAKAESRRFAEADGRRLVAVDIGTTTIAMQLYGATGIPEAHYVCINPQVKCGADVLSRIQAAEDGAVRQQLREMVESVIEEGSSRFEEYLQPGESMQMLLAGNTTMIYLLCGYDPAELGRAPFHASHVGSRECSIRGNNCYIFPGLSAFVGGDIVAGIYAAGMHEREELTLFIDLGTNGEMAFGNRERRIACATAAGPAFEGGVNRGIWGADMVHLLARLRREGIVDETGLLAGEYFDGGVRIGDVCVTQASIRAIQLAKAAIRAGIEVLLLRYGLPENAWEQIDRVVLAGGFGYHLDPQEAAQIGLIPEELADKAVAGGNTVLAGAERLWRESDKIRGGSLQRTHGGNGGEHAERTPLRGVLDNTEVLNLAGQPEFEELYIQYMDFPILIL